jgi:hypothetical protein
MPIPKRFFNSIVFETAHGANVIELNVGHCRRREDVNRLVHRPSKVELVRRGYRFIEHDVLVIT